MTKNSRIMIAVQKKGRLNRDSLRLLERCGVKFNYKDDHLVVRAENMPIDMMFVRDDDIPTLVGEGICDLGIVGDNVLQESLLDTYHSDDLQSCASIKRLGFGHCRLALCVPQTSTINKTTDLEGCRIATSYPLLTRQFLRNQHINCEVFQLNGSVEIAPGLGMADAICDLVSTGKTLEEHDLRELKVVYQSEALLIQSSNNRSQKLQQWVQLLLRRLDGALKARDSKYIMLHAPKNRLEVIKQMLPGSESPTTMAIEDNDKVAVHAVAQEGVFWSTLENLKQQGASSILVLPIEKMM